ncbi:MAG: cobalt ECF transporter T component CbiQ [Clostridia bacterium]|nr:cobalt ECF transporter T component CbiQ [Clostridia bacterium]
MENKKECMQLAAIPDWLLEKNTYQDVKKAGKSSTGFLRRTLTEISGVVQNDLLSERIAAKKGFLQGVDPRVKLISLLLFMAFVGTTQSIITILLLCASASLMVMLSGVGFLSYIKRVWMVIPLILLVLSLPAATNVFIKGTPLIYVYGGLDINIGVIELPQELYFSVQGVASIVKMALRIGGSISFGYVLVMTTRWSHITKALRVLRVPKLIITILDMTYRYIFVLARLMVEIFEARYLRTVGKISNKENRRFVSNGLAFLFVRASYMSEEIYDSMVCRGYTGEPVSVNSFKISGNDFIWIFNCLIIIGVLIIL